MYFKRLVWVRAPAKKLLGPPPPPPNKGGRAKNIYTKVEGLTVAEWLGLGVRGLICAINTLWHYRERQKRMQQSGGLGPLPDRWAPLIFNDFAPPPLVGTGGSISIHVHGTLFCPARCDDAPEPSRWARGHYTFQMRTDISYFPLCSLAAYTNSLFGGITVRHWSIRNNPYFRLF
jgi:hypothetical protein